MPVIVAAHRHIKELPAKLRFFLPFFVIKSLSGIRFCEIERDFCEIEKDFLRIEKDFLRIERDFLRIETDFCEVEKDFCEVEKDFALSPPAMRVVRRAFEEGENRPCRLG